MNDERLNTPWRPMTLQQVVGLFALLIKKPPDYQRLLNQADSARKEE